ncbi:MAG: SGNH/GDSL hydrolase family protein [Betaproteobacteria bacterium]|nr:SGNH/GDSL hydrolase family protein [Betaproteobacteria bacterium]
MAANKKPVLIFPGDIDSTDPAKNPPDYTYRLLAEGDSWFSYGSWRLRNLPLQLRFTTDTMIVTLAEPGDTIVRMADICRNPALEMQLDKRFGYNWHAILLSGGGNDIIDNAGKIIPPSSKAQPSRADPADYCDLDALRRVLATIAKGYAAIVDLRDRAGISPCVGKPIVIHTYDLCAPRDSPARFAFLTLGPWLYPAMIAAKIPQARWNDVADVVMNALADKLLALPNKLPNVHVVDTRGLLTRSTNTAKGISNDWENEIHPTADGYRKIAKPISQRLASLLP